ncbi:MAG: hypothetical protein PF569_03325 [Candidatus Woesearchaeota archaeon]|jgi:hypothetical protein|nr:hypothetical protein [Candidatus Woesearchaeota archaeon]
MHSKLFGYNHESIVFKEREINFKITYFSRKEHSFILIDYKLNGWKNSTYLGAENYDESILKTFFGDFKESEKKGIIKLEELLIKYSLN